MKYNIDYFTKKFSDIPQRLDYVALGSTQGHFMYDFTSLGVAGFNMSLFKDIYHYKQLLEKYENNINNEAKVLINIAYPMFLCDINEDYSEIEKYQSSVVLYGCDWKMSKEEQDDYLSNPYKYIKAPLFKGFILNSERNRYINIMSSEETFKYSSYIITSGWEPEIKISNISKYKSRKKSESETKRVTDNIDYLSDVIHFIREKDWIPVLVGAPYSGVFNDLISKDFKRDFFYESVDSIKRKETVSFLDYSNDEELKDINLYLDVWNLNDHGRTIFTKKILKDLDS